MIRQHGRDDGQGLHGDAQRLPFSESQAQDSAHERANTRQKRPFSGQSLLDRAHASKRSRQGTLDSGTKAEASSVVDSHNAVANNGQTASVSPHSSVCKVPSSQLQTAPGSTQCSRQHSMHASPHANVVQVLDLTDADDQPTCESSDKHSQSFEMQAPASGPDSLALISDSARKRRRQTLLHAHKSSNNRQASADLVDLT